jgi:hypothetical protein
VWLLAALEFTALATAALVGMITALARIGSWFAGGTVWSHLLPFAASVLALGVCLGLFLWCWLRLRVLLLPRAPFLPVLVAIAAAACALGFTMQPRFEREMAHLRSLVGGAAEAERGALAHQVYAAYRRSDLSEMQIILERGRVFAPTIHEAAEALGMDAEILVGIAATESSFYPRQSKDGGHGLFQVTVPPRDARETARRLLRVDKLDSWNQRHNAFVAAATLRRYLTEMRGDLVLAILAYNIGPRNGGLRSIMEQYGAREFVTVQPYLKNLPRDYPIRVLAAALAYRLWRLYGELPRYEEAENAVRIQAAGIPGFQAWREREADSPS